MDVPPDDIDRLRAEMAEWRRRAEIAEAVAAERLARAETAEKALEAARALPKVTIDSRPADVQAGTPPTAPARSMRERWRRYIESIN